MICLLLINNLEYIINNNLFLINYQLHFTILVLNIHKI